MATQQSSSDSKKLRLFIALELPEEMLAELAAAQDRLRRKLKFDLRWVRPEGIHLTLKFLGYVDEPRLPTIQEALSRAVAGKAAPRLRLGEVGSFGGPRPRVVWVGLAGDVDKLGALQSSIDRATARLGFEPETRPYSAHLTLARVPEGLNRLQQNDLLHAMAHTMPPAPLQATFHEVSLVQSTLRREGAVYTRLYAAPLRG